MSSFEGCYSVAHKIPFVGEVLKRPALNVSGYPELREDK
jgi:hypothetical protein